MEQIIKTEGLTRSFNTDAGELHVLRGIDISFVKGETIAIIGASGAGKSTFLHVLGTIDRPTLGRVFYDNKDIFKLNDHELAAFRNNTIGFVFQFHHLMPEFNALENIMMPGLIAGMDTKSLTHKAQNLLKDIGLDKRTYHRPGELSGGEQQRVAVARALVMDPLLVLADEPTGNLDTKAGESLFDLLIELNKQRGTTLIMVTHNETLAARCHKIYEMSDGTLTS